MSHLLTVACDPYGLPPCYITENRACHNMEPGENGIIDDQPRLYYLKEQPGVVRDAIESGLPVKGYFAWSLMDNSMWAEGYRMRFGIVHVDYETQVRTIKKSGHWYSDLVARHAGQKTVAE